MWKSPWDWKLFSTGGASARSLWKQWQHQAIPSRSCQRLSSKLPVGHKKIGKKSFLMLNVHHNNIGDGQIWIPSSRGGGSLFHFWIALFPTRLKLGISFAFHYSSPNQIYRHINLSIAKKKLKISWVDKSSFLQIGQDPYCHVPSGSVTNLFLFSHAESFEQAKDEEEALKLAYDTYSCWRGFISQR